MNLLALEFSTRQRAVCVSSKSGQQATAATNDLADGPMALIDSVLQEAGLTPSDIETIAIGLGPGSYTGIRSAIAIAQGFQLGRSVRLCGISSADVIAHSSKMQGEFAVVIDAQRGEFYRAMYRRTNDTIELISALEIVSPDNLPDQDCTIIGPEVERLAGRGNNVLPAFTELARLARNNPAFSEGHELEPIYLRTPEFKKAPPPRQIQ